MYLFIRIYSFIYLVAYENRAVAAIKHEKLWQEKKIIIVILTTRVLHGENF